MVDVVLYDADDVKMYRWDKRPVDVRVKYAPELNAVLAQQFIRNVEVSPRFVGQVSTAGWATMAVLR